MGIFTSNSIGGYDYLHYWYSDYEANSLNAKDSSELYSNFLKTKQNIGFQKYFGKTGIAFQEYQNRLNNLQLDWGVTNKEFESILNFLYDDESQERKAIFEQEAVKNVSAKKMVYDAASNMSPEQIATIIDNFLKQLERVIQQMYQKINGKPWEDFKFEVVQEYIKATQGQYGVLSSSELTQSVINDFLTHQGIVKWGLKTTTGGSTTGQSALQTSLRNIALLIDALPDYGTGGNQTLGPLGWSTTAKSGVTGDGLSTLYKIAEKLQGLFNNIVGQGGEIAWKTAEKTIFQKLIDQEKLLDFLTGDAFVETEVIGGENITITRSSSTNNDLKKDIQKKAQKEIKSVSKGDVKVIITKGKITIVYGVSVKTYNFNTKTGAKTVTLVDETPFMTAANKLFGGSESGIRYMFNLAGGHSGSKKGTKYGESLTNLNEKWDALVKEVVARNFIDVIAGFVSKEGPTTLYLVLNGQIIPITTVLDNLASQTLDFSSRLINNNITLKRHMLVKLNPWHFTNNAKNNNRYWDKNVIAAEERSKEALSAINTTLQQQKLIVSLTQLQNILI